MGGDKAKTTHHYICCTFLPFLQQRQKSNHFLMPTATKRACLDDGPRDRKMALFQEMRSPANSDIGPRTSVSETTANGLGIIQLMLARQGNARV